MTAEGRALQAALIALGVLGRAAHRFNPTRPAPSELAALFRDASPEEVAAAARAMSGLRYQNRALVEMARRRGQGLLAELVDAASLDRLRAHAGAPAIFVGWHVGPPFGVIGAFKAAGVDVLIIRRSMRSDATAMFEFAAVEGGRGPRSAAFRRGVDRLRGGGAVLMAVDAPEMSQTAPVPCFGRARAMARGPFAMARLTGAKLVPLASQLDHDRVVRVAVGPPLVGGDSDDDVETSLAAGAAAWLEATLRESPRQMRRCVLQWLLDAPPIT
jgi:lauroyl/myristoyl acyltransferase